MASYLKKYIDHPGKAIDILEKVIKEISGNIDFNDYDANSTQLNEVTKAIETLAGKGVDVPENLRRLKSTLSLSVHDQEKIIQQVQGLEIRLSSVLDGLRLMLSKKGQATTTRRLKKRYVHETSPKILQKEIRKALRELGGQGRKKQIIEIIQRNLDGNFKKNDRVKKNGTEQWILNVSKERSFMVRDGVLKSGSPRGVWELRGR
ncbi:hypothetical protein [Desulfobacter curvatus]|uniref:hypothetical protein n=1 Tax=Desulfobacter curvatus TaxID=2290 RepID=UPI000360F7EF|nr:hypothetical protein [Desulfobacter curvatus]